MVQNRNVFMTPSSRDSRWSTAIPLGTEKTRMMCSYGRFKNFKTRLITIRFFKNRNFDFRSEFLLYRLRHFNDTCPWSITNGRPVRRLVRSAHIKRSENLTRAQSNSDSCVAATTRCVRLTDAFTIVLLTASISPPQ